VTASDDGSLALSVVIPALNAGRDLPACLESIRQQRTAPDAYEIVIADGGSTDSTRALAESAGARVVDNPLRKAEPGVAIGVQASRGRFITVMAADNRMCGEDFIERMLDSFEDPDVMAAFPRVISTAEDGLVGRYFNRYSDPFNHFVYGSLNTSIDLMLRRGDRVLHPTVTSHPLLAVAQGCTFRSGLVYEGPPAEADDVLAIIELIERGGKFVLVGDAQLEHHHVSGLGPVYRKYERRTREALVGRQGYRRREEKLTRSRRLKRWLWVPYSASLIAPAIHGVLLAARHRDPLLLFHPVVNAVVFAAVMHGALARGDGTQPVAGA
jgi:glycosyltransferase involved in cell wall biosynthesis